MVTGLTIGVDGRDLLPKALTGMGRCVYNLLEDVCHEARGHQYVVFCNQTNAVKLSRPSDSVKVLTMAEGNRIWWDQFLLPRALMREGVDVFFSPYPKVPIRSTAPSVNMIHDVIPLTWPDYRNPLSVHFKRRLYQFWASRASRTVTVSHHAKESIAGELGLDPDRIVVIPNRISKRFLHRPSPSEVQAVREALQLPGDFCLYVGRAAPHKNVGSLLEAYSRLPHELRSAYPLVLAGAGGTEADRLLAGLEPPFRSAIRFLGWVSDDALKVLYHEAALFVFPSLAEGFGYPPLEAMACGAPVIAVRTGPMPEVLGEAPYWLESGKPEDLVRAMAALLGSESIRQEVIERGRRQAERFATTHSTERLLECLEAVWEENRRTSP